jgi:hypothetical protein
VCQRTKRLSGGPGIDAIIALGGNDNITAGNFGTLNIADNAVEGVSCGAGVDTAYIGANENDVPDNDCETVIIRPYLGYICNNCETN